MNKINTYLTKLIRYFSDCGRILTQNLQYPQLVIKDISECPAILFDIDEERKYRTDTKQRWPVLRITIIKYMKYRLVCMATYPLYSELFLWDALFNCRQI